MFLSGFIIYILVSFSRDVKSQEICTNATLGNFPEAKHTDFLYGGLFVDIYNRVPCDSNVLGWQVCFFPPSDHREAYAVQLSVFKHDAPINGILYLQRPESVYNASFSGASLINGGGMDNCRTISLPENEQFVVNQNEFIGVYIEEVADFTGFRNGYILDIIGNTTNGTKSIAWRCPRQDNTIIYALDAYSSCFGRLNNHLIQARLLMSNGNGNMFGTNIPGNDSNTLGQPTTVPTITQTEVADTSSTQPTPSQFMNTTNTQQRADILVPLSVVGACLIVLLIASIISVLTVIIVHQRRKARLEMMRWRKERRNIMPGKIITILLLY